MNKEILEYLNNNSKKIERLEKDEKVVKHNLTNNMHTWIKGYTDEMKYANEDRKKTLKREIENIKQDIIDTEEKVAQEYDNKKKQVLADSVNKVKEYADEFVKDVKKKIKEDKTELAGLKKEISDNTIKNNFDRVIILAAHAREIETKIIGSNTVYDNAMTVIVRITKVLDDMDNLSFEDLKSEYDSYICEVSKLSTEVDFRTRTDNSNPEKNDTKEILYYLEEAKDEKNDISKRKDSLNKAIELINKLNNNTLRNDLLDKSKIVEKDIEKAANAIAEKKKLEEILQCMKKAQDVNNSISERKEFLEKAYKLVDKLADETLKEDLLADLASVYDAIKKDDTVVDPDYEFAINLVEKAEKTEKAKDYVKAYEAILKVAEEKRDALIIRFNKISDKNDGKFKILLEELKKQKDDSKKLDKAKLLELEDRYKYISEPVEKESKSDFEGLIIYNNNFYQDEYKKNYKLKKDNFFTKVGKIFTFVKGSKIATKFNLKKLEKIKSMVADAEDKDEKDYLEAQYLKTSNKLIANSTVGGLRLFVAKKRLEGLKTKLYSGKDLTEKQQRKYDKSVKVIDKNMNKGLDAKTEIEIYDKAYITSMVDQYLYLISTGESIDESTTAFEQYLEKVKDKLTESEYKAIYDQLYIIHDYRSANDNAIYEFKSDIVDGKVTTELDDIVKYYDSEECNIGSRQTPIYIKR